MVHWWVLVYSGRGIKGDLWGVASSLVENKLDIRTVFSTNFEGKKNHSLFFHYVEFDTRSPI
jgi:hypothetical protein